MSILIVDDAEDTRGLIRAVLEAGGYEDIITADSAGDAFLKLGLPDEAAHVCTSYGAGGDLTDLAADDIDLILLDIMLPDMDGIEVCRRIKASERYKDTSVIMVTAKKEGERLESSFNSGASDYIRKPLDRVELLARVRLAMKLKKSMDDYRGCRKKLEDARLKIERFHALYSGDNGTPDIVIP